MKVLVRDAEPADYEAIAELAAQLVGSEADRQVAFRSALEEASHDLIVADTVGTVVGFAHVLAYDDLTHGARAADLLGLYVRADHRRRGVGTSLLGEVRRRARQRGVRELHVNTEPDNEAALSFYQHHGAHIVGTQLEFELG